MRDDDEAANLPPVPKEAYEPSRRKPGDTSLVDAFVKNLNRNVIDAEEKERAEEAKKK